MEITSQASRKLNILGGIAVLSYLAVRAYRPHSPRGMAVKYVFLGLALAISLLHVCLQLYRSRGTNPAVTEQPPSTGLPRRGLSNILFMAIRFAGDSLALVGRHAVVLVLAARFDTHFQVLYKEYGRIYRVVERVLVDISLAECIVLSADRFSGLFKNVTSIYNIFRGAKADREFLDVWQNVINAAFYVSFTYAYVCRFIMTTMYSKLILTDAVSLRILRIMVLFALLIAVWSSAQEKRHPVWLLQLFILAVGILHYRDGGERYLILAMCILIVASAGKNARTILKISVIGGISCLIFSYLSARTGIIEEYIAHTATEGMLQVRHTFGVNSPTDHAAHLLFIVTAWCLLLIRSKYRKWYHYLSFVPMLFFYLVAFRYNYARIASFCILAVILITIAREIFTEFVSGHPVKLPGALKKAITVCFAGLSSLYLVFFGWSCYMMQQADVESVWIPFRSTLLSSMNLSSIDHRIQVSQASFQSYSLSLFGQKIKEIGFGGGKNPTLEMYTFMDISYVKILFAGGILFTAILLGLLTFIQFRNLRQKLYASILLLAVIALDCLLEHHIFEFYYNVFPLLAFSIWIEQKVPRTGITSKSQASLRRAS